MAAIILFNSGAIEYIGEIHETSAEFTCGEGVPPKAGEPLGTTLRSYDGLVTPYGVIDFTQCFRKSY